MSDDHENDGNDSSAIVEAANKQLREQLENSAGAAFTGADARSLRFTFDARTSSP